VSMTTYILGLNFSPKTRIVVPIRLEETLASSPMQFAICCMFVNLLVLKKLTLHQLKSVFGDSIDQMIFPQPKLIHQTSERYIIVKI